MFCIFVFFFFKQKTAYEMRISDWSSDVCSSDLEPGAADVAAPLERARSESQSAHAVEGIEAAQAAADDRDIELKSVVTSVERGGNVAHVVALLLSVWWRNADRPVRRTRGHIRNTPLPLVCRSNSLRSEEHTSELQSLMRISYAVCCLKK